MEFSLKMYSKLVVPVWGPNIIFVLFLGENNISVGILIQIGGSANTNCWQFGSVLAVWVSLPL